MSPSGSGNVVDETVVDVGSQEIDEEQSLLGDGTAPHPFYFEVVDQIDGMCLVMMAWLSQLADSRYTREIKTDISELTTKVIMFKSSLEMPSTNPEFVRNYDAEWGELKVEFEGLKHLVEALQLPTKRLRRTPSGDEPDTVIE